MLGIIGSSATSSLTELFLFGIGFYLLDRRSWSLATYRFLYDFFHHDPMPLNITRGVLFNQSVRRKWAVAGLLSTLLFVHTVWEFKIGAHLLAEVIIWMLGIPMMLIGMWFGYQIQERLLPNKGKLFDAADEWTEKLDKVSLDDVKKGVEGVGTGLARHFTGSWFRPRTASKPARVTEVPVVPPPATPEPPREDPREALRRFTRR